MPDANTLGIALGTVLGFLAGALVVCFSYCCLRRRAKSFNLEPSPNGCPRDTHRTTIEYFAGPASSFSQPYTVPMQVQPSVFKLNKKTASEGYPTQYNNTLDNPFEKQPPHVDQALKPVEENDDDNSVSSLSSVSGDSSTNYCEIAKSRKSKLSKRLSLPAGVVMSSADLVHHSPEHFLRKKKGENESASTKLEFSLFFDTASRELHITIIEVTNIPTPDESFLRLPNCSVKMRILPEMLTWQWSRKVVRTDNPVFNETFIIPGFVHNKLRECTVHFVVLDFDHVQDNVYVIGEVFMPLSELRANKLDKLVKQVNPLLF